MNQNARGVIVFVASEFTWHFLPIDLVPEVRARGHLIERASDKKLSALFSNDALRQREANADLSCLTIG